MRRTVKITTDIESLFGTLDENLKRFEAVLRITTHLNDNSLELEGEAENVERAERFLRDYMTLVKEGHALDNGEVQSVLRILEQDQNASLRGLLNLAPDGMLSYVTARVVADSGGIFVRSMLVNAGARHGVAKGHAVLSGEGLAGRIGAVGDRSARVLLITDLNSKIPVVIESTRVRGLVAGDNSARPKLVFLPPNATAAVGDRIVTSGHGGGLPAGLPVGEVAAVGSDGIRVRPFADLDRLDYLRVVRFQDVVPPVEATRTVERAK